MPQELLDYLNHKIQDVDVFLRFSNKLIMDNISIYTFVHDIMTIILRIILQFFKDVLS